MRRTSLSPPPDKNVTWEQYLDSEINNYPRLGRDLVYKETAKSFKATIAMVNTTKFALKIFEYPRGRDVLQKFVLFLVSFSNLEIFNSLP